MNKKIISALLTIVMTSAALAGCTDGDKEDSGLANTNKVDNAIENASAVADTTGFVYTGEAPITNEGGKLKILAQESNYSFVDIGSAPRFLRRPEYRRNGSFMPMILMKKKYPPY